MWKFETKEKIVREFPNSEFYFTINQTSYLLFFKFYVHSFGCVEQMNQLKLNDYPLLLNQSGKFTCSLNSTTQLT
jgi:hypothetical protein